MAHDIVAVISKNLKDVHKLLDLHWIYYPIEDMFLDDMERITYTREEVISRAKGKLEEFNKVFYSKYLMDKESFKKQYKYWPGFLEYVEKVFPEELKRSDDEIYEDIVRHQLSLKRKEDGSVSLDYNPDRKFARYSLPRTQGTLWDFKCPDRKIRRKTKGRVKDLMRERRPLKNERVNLQKYWDGVMKRPEDVKEIIELDGLTPDTSERYKDCCNKRDALIGIYGDFENFLKYNNKVQSFAVITPDGKWHENVLRDWFGNVTHIIEGEKEWIDNYYERFIEPYGEYFITFVEVSEY